MFLAHHLRFLRIIAAAAVAAACGDSSSPDQTSDPAYSISGVVTGVGGVTVRISDSQSTRSIVTQADGSFSVGGLRPGTYTVSPVQAGHFFDPAASTVTIVAANAIAQPFVRRPAEEGLSEANALRIDGQPESSVALDAVVLPNGQKLAAYAQARGITPAGSPAPPMIDGNPAAGRASNIPVANGPQQKKNDAIAQMVMSAHDYACGRQPVPCTKWNYPADPTGTAGSPKPAHNGLTYIWGGKFENESNRSLPGDGCPELTFGMDCSGLISKIAGKAGLAAPAGSVNQADPAKWSIPADWKLKFKRVTDGSFQTGDLVAWNGHIGIAASDGRADVPVISSTGVPGECRKNIERPRGPRTLTIAQLGLGTPRAVLRLVTTLSGDWDLYLRCVDQTTDAARIRFTIDNDEGGSFRATGVGIDYNGAPLSFILEGTYDQSSNTVSAVLSFTDGTRRDSFSTTLFDDATNYLPLTKVVDNRGCSASVRLVRVQPSAVNQASEPPARPRNNAALSLLRPAR